MEQELNGTTSTELNVVAKAIESGKKARKAVALSLESLCKTCTNKNGNVSFEDSTTLIVATKTATGWSVTYKGLKVGTVTKVDGGWQGTSVNGAKSHIYATDQKEYRAARHLAWHFVTQLLAGKNPTTETSSRTSSAVSTSTATSAPKAEVKTKKAPKAEAKVVVKTTPKVVTTVKEIA